MVIGLALIAAGLTIIAFATAPWIYLAGWLLLGPAMRMSLYDAAFAALVQAVPSRGRRAISLLTLFGGLASTVFWPIGYWLDASYGWRMTLLIFAGLNLLVAAPLTWWGLAHREPEGMAPASSAAGKQNPDLDRPPLLGRDRAVAIGLFGVVLAANSFAFGALSAHLVSVLHATGLALGAAVALASLKGVAQVAGRVWELYFAQGLSAVALGRLAIALLPVSFVVLMLGGASYETALTFTLLLGVSNGLVTIVRGAVPLALFGREGYGTMLGLLATPQLMMNAVAPFAFAAVVEALGAPAGLWVLLAAALVSIGAMELTSWWVHRARARSGA
jgi:predicted MFS family arabinose efflux permease